MGKTQFAMSLLAQLAHHSGSRFGIADFKNDYSDDTGFPAYALAEFIDLWNTGAPYNPLALEDDSGRAVTGVRDTAARLVDGLNRPAPSVPARHPRRLGCSRDLPSRRCPLRRDDLPALWA